MSNPPKPVSRTVVWLGDSRKNIRAFPAGAQKLIGDELQLMQFVRIPKDAKAFKGVGSGGVEIAVAFDGNAYRTVLALQLAEKNLCPPCLP